MRRGECGCVAATREVHSDTRRPGEERVRSATQPKQYDAVCLERSGRSRTKHSDFKHTTHRQNNNNIYHDDYHEGKRGVRQQRKAHRGGKQRHSHLTAPHVGPLAATVSLPRRRHKRTHQRQARGKNSTVISSHRHRSALPHCSGKGVRSRESQMGLTSRDTALAGSSRAKRCGGAINCGDARGQREAGRAANTPPTPPSLTPSRLECHIDPTLTRLWVSTVPQAGRGRAGVSHGGGQGTLTRGLLVTCR
ncbi:hypothetical protein E2C01_046655 [Portunus trituberculatus]|uniref:Uncharacterized protein n=1 Tax=Portunus trituberculatus TaxID=210409 RepID=A0A5B7G5P5_PORTR|nr:hypothetical protein [Portunus trituberculatus]